MRVLVLAPHPFFQLRGTPIDVDVFLRALSARPDVEIDLLVYGEGEDREYSGVTTYRIPSFSLTRGVKPGFSIKKIINDVALFFKAWKLVHRNSYDVIHAGEETAFMAGFFKAVYGIPFVYDLDSSIAQQMVEKHPILTPAAPIFHWLEGSIVRAALAVAPVCNALADLCRDHGANHIVTLHDISQLRDPDRRRSGRLQKEAGTDRLILLYVGNLEAYQGIDLLLEGFSIAARRTNEVDLALIGGDADDIEHYTAKADRLKLDGRAHFLGPRPFAELDEFLADADILTAPRIKGINTPMKVFPYLHSGRPVLVTDLPTHSQIITRDVALLAQPTPEAFGDAIVQLAEDRDMRDRLARAGRAFVEAGHTYPLHEQRVNSLYDWVARQLKG